MGKKKYTESEIIDIIEEDVKKKYKDISNNESIAILVLINSIAYYCTYKDTYIDLINNKYNLNFNTNNIEIIEEICHEHLYNQLKKDNNLTIEYLTNVINEDYIKDVKFREF